MTEIPKTFEPAAIEAHWYAHWEITGCFAADPASTKPAYSIVIPPPNVTGQLTLGHVLNNTIQDILARRARMTGHEVLWLPGTDHAGIATQNVVEKTLRKEGKMKHRDDLGREALVGKIWEWKEKYGGIILKQLRALGASCDWSRTRFTMDEDYSRCVQSVFVDLYKKGHIYRGKRMVNWCPASLTALSDEEVVPKQQNGFLYHFRVEVVEPCSGTGASPVNVSAAAPAASGEGARATTTGGGASATTTTTTTQAWRGTGRWLTIATTRPETIPGDSAVAVNPKDARYADLIGKHIRRPLPLENQAPLPIVGDEHVTFDFGTGVLKVTPAHDKADFEIGERHGLEVIDIMHPNAVMNELAGVDLAGLDRFAARKRAVEILKEAGVLEKEEPYQNNVGYSERADVPIEPRLSEQWFLKYPSVDASKACVQHDDNPRKSRAVSAASSIVSDNSNDEPVPEWRKIINNCSILGAEARVSSPSTEQMRFFPDRWAKVYEHWMDGIKDWCISRQLWWGHRVPVWTKRFDRRNEYYCAEAFGKITGHLPEGLERKLLISEKGSLRRTPGGKMEDLEDGTVTDIVATDDPNIFEWRVLTSSPEQAKRLADEGYTQDPDVLDTWFSSWLWPFATMGWPEKTNTLAKFYPTTDLVTGPDIIFFWVARMIMAGYEYMGELPFKNVYFTGIIRDKQGRKMSKSLGNSPDPLDLISQYGADALRFGVMRSAPLGSDVLFDDKNVELGRNFCTKLWNAARFRQMHEGEVEGEINPTLLTSDEKWILLRLDAAIAEVTLALTEYRFSDAANALYRFFWNEYCDWFVEASKATLVARTPSSVNSADASSGEPEKGATAGAAPAHTDGTSVPRKANTLAVMDFVFSHTLRLFHPFMPFITEDLWQSMGFAKDMPPKQGGETIMFAPWPKAFTAEEREYFILDETDEAFANAKYEVVNRSRSLRRDFNIASNKRVRFVLKPNAELPAHEAAVLQILLNAEPFEVDAAYAPSKGTPAALTPLGELFLPLDGLIDVTAERERIGKEIAKVESELEKVRAKLADENFAAKVPAKVLEDHRQREIDWSEKHTQLVKMRDALGA